MVAIDGPRVGPVQQTPLAEQARERIRASILDGTIRPGERLTIEQLAGELGISRTPVREALKALEQDGLVHLLPHRGAVVESVALEEVHHRYTIRAMLEGLAAELACKAAARKVAQELASICSEMEGIAKRAKREDENATRRLSDVNRDFHRLIGEASGSRTLIRLLDSLHNPASYSYSHWRDPQQRDAFLKIHREIADAFKQANPQLCRELMERHILDARDGIVDSGDESRAVDA